MGKVQPLTEEELQKLEELQALQKRQEEYEKQQAQREARLERERFNAKCKEVFGMGKTQVDEALKKAGRKDYFSEYYELKSLVERLKKAWGKDNSWSFAEYVERVEQKAKENATS